LIRNSLDPADRIAPGEATTYAHFRIRKMRMYAAPPLEDKKYMCHGMSSFPIGMPMGMCRRGESINRLCRALADPVQRREFLRDEDAFCLRMGLDRTSRHAIRDRDYLRLIDLGGHVAQLDLLAALSGMNTLEALQKLSGVPASNLFGQGWGSKP